MAYALGIDIGTTYTAAAAWRDGRAATVPLGDRAHSVPSALFLRDDGVMLVGDAANRRGTTDPNRVAREFKRRLGDEAPLLLGDTEMSAQQLTGYLVRWVVEKVTEREGEPPAHVTLTCPATWGDYRRQLMTEAAGTARLTDVGLLPEPVAAAVYYASQERLDPDSLVAVYDLGGGTFDATVVRKTDGGFEVHGTAGGDETVGGTDFDQVVMDHVASTTGLRWAEFDTADPTVLAGLAQVRAHAVGAKEALSTDVDATIPVILPDVTRDVRITRAEFEAAIRIPILRTVDTLAQTLAAAGVEPAELRAVLLVGGSSRIPLVSRLIATELGVPVAVDAHPKYAVCLGAAISAGSRLPAAAPRFGAPPAAAPFATAPPAAAPFATAPPAAAPPATAPPVGAPAAEPAVWRPPGAAPDPAAWAPPGVDVDPALEVPAWEGPTVQTPTVGAPDAPADEGAELLAPEPDPHAAVHVDLAGAGLDVPLDVLLRPEPVPTRPMPRLTGQDEPLTVDHTGDPRRGRLTVLAVAAAAVVVVASASALGVAAGSGGPEPTGPVGTGPPSAGPASTPPTATEPALP
ncbi:MAG TPA: Hsp70 family protein, partial [Pilimelia sp.]|nr:Hsp70 family protein [Pilimelia sp.]